MLSGRRFCRRGRRGFLCQEAGGSLLFSLSSIPASSFSSMTPSAADFVGRGWRGLCKASVACTGRACARVDAPQRWNPAARHSGCFPRPRNPRARAARAIDPAPSRWVRFANSPRPRQVLLREREHIYSKWTERQSVACINNNKVMEEGARGAERPNNFAAPRPSTGVAR